MTDSHNCLLDAIAFYRAENAVSPAFSACLDRLESHGFLLTRDHDALMDEIRPSAADFVIHYIALALDDHCLSEREMGNILALKRIYGLDEGDLLALQAHKVAELVRGEMERILEDERVDDPEALHQSDLQRSLDLGYDQYLALTRDIIRPAVEKLLDQARGQSQQRQDSIIRRLQALQTVVRIDSKTMTAIWTDSSVEST